MIIFGNLLVGIALVLEWILQFTIFFIIARVIISWVNADPYNPIVRAILNITDPIFSFVKKYVPTVFGAIDLTPIFVILVIVFLQTALVNTLRDYGTYFRRTSIYAVP